MAKKKSEKDKSKTKRKGVKVGTDAFWALCRSVREGRLEATRLDGSIKDAQALVANAMLSPEGKKLGRQLSSDDVGLKVTVTQSETDKWDDQGVWGALTPRERPKAFDRDYDFSALTPERRAELHKAMIAMLSPAEKRLCVRNRLNVARMSQAVQAGDIDAEKIAPFMETHKGTPYITVTPHGA